MLAVYIAFFCLLVSVILIIPARIKIVVLLGSKADKQILQVEVLSVIKQFNKTYTYDLESRLLSIIDGTGFFDRFLDYQTKAENQTADKTWNAPSSAYYKALKSGLNNALVEKFEWRTEIGLDNAMNTAISVGALWALKGILVSSFSRQSHLKKLKLEVEPDFSAVRLWSRLDCIVKMRLVHIMIVAIKLLAINWAEGFKSFKSKHSFPVSWKQLTLSITEKWGY